VSIRALLGAAAVAVSVGAAAEAATIEAYNVRITLDDVQYWCNFCQSGETPPEINSAFGLDEGSSAVGSLSITTDEERLSYSLTFGSSSVAGSNLMLFDGLWTDFGGFNRFSWNAGTGAITLLDDGTPWEQVTQLSLTEVAPVPLPATAALLPLGLGALAMMRRRRKAAN
jgi:hypothetical protein